MSVFSIVLPLTNFIPSKPGHTFVWYASPYFFSSGRLLRPLTLGLAEGLLVGWSHVTRTSWHIWRGWWGWGGYLAWSIVSLGGRIWCGTIPPPSTRYAEHDRRSILLDHKIHLRGLYLANMIKGPTGEIENVFQVLLTLQRLLEMEL